MFGGGGLEMGEGAEDGGGGFAADCWVGGEGWGGDAPGQGKGWRGLLVICSKRMFLLTKDLLVHPTPLTIKSTASPSMTRVLLTASTSLTSPLMIVRLLLASTPLFARESESFEGVRARAEHL